MSLHYRKRGKFWHVRGTIRVGRRVFQVKEHSTGCIIKADAEAVGAAEEARIRSEALDGTAPRVRVVTIAECIALYRARPGGLHPFDQDRLAELESTIGPVLLTEARAAWGSWLRGRGQGLAPPTVARWRSTFLVPARQSWATTTRAQTRPVIHVARQLGMATCLVRS